MEALRVGEVGGDSADWGLEGISNSNFSLVHYKNALEVICPEGFAIVTAVDPE
jgi:hypothetical protein